MIEQSKHQTVHHTCYRGRFIQMQTFEICVSLFLTCRSHQVVCDFVQLICVLKSGIRHSAWYYIRSANKFLPLLQLKRSKTKTKLVASPINWLEHARNFNQHHLEKSHLTRHDISFMSVSSFLLQCCCAMPLFAICNDQPLRLSPYTTTPSSNLQVTFCGTYCQATTTSTSAHSRFCVYVVRGCCPSVLTDAPSNVIFGDGVTKLFTFT